MEVHPLTLAFTGSSGDLEAKFLDVYARDSLFLIRLTLMIGILIYALFGSLDVIVASEAKNKFWLVRFAIVCPIILFIFFFSFSERFLKHIQIYIVCSILVAGLGVVYMTVAGNFLTARTYYTGLILVIMLAYSTYRARFIWASSACLVIVISYFFATTITDSLPREILANNLFFCMSANIIGMLACYTLEYYARRDFFMATLLNAQHQKLTTAKTELEHQVRQRTAMLTQTIEELRHEIQAHQKLDLEKKSLEDQLRQAQKIEALGTLAGGIAHDFNNILAAIMGHADLAMIQKDDPQHVENCLNEVFNASDRAKNLVGQILAFSRHSESELQPIQISLVIQEVLRLLRASLPTTISIEKDIQATQTTIIGDTTQIHQVLMNLCTNASHAMAANGGVLKVELNEVDLKNPKVLQSSVFSTPLNSGKYVRLRVSDSGHGIPFHLQDRILDPYFTTKAKGVGTGLGLAVVQGIVQSHGGSIDMKSRPGEGTVFDVFFPVIEASAKSEFKSFQHIDTGNERILLVDDDEVLADLSAKLLTTIGYRVVSHTNPNAALADFKKSPDDFDLVITDMVMPMMNGEAFIRAVRGVRMDVPVIIYTGFSDTIDSERLKKSGIKKILRKPVTILGLSQSIREVLEEANASHKNS